MARLERFDKKDNHFNSDTVAICVHGGGGSVFGEKHPVVQLLLDTAANTVYSLELPGHGKNTVDAPVPVVTAAEQIYEAVAPVVQDRPAVFVGYSAGGIFLLKLWPRLRRLMRPESLGVFIGSGLRSKAGWTLIDAFWRPERFEAENKAGAMVKLHGAGWKSTLESVRRWSAPDSAAFPTDAELRALFTPDERVFLVLGETDQPYPLEDNLFCLDAESAARKALVVPSDHFSYFAAGWPYVESALRFFLRVAGADRTLQQQQQHSKL